MTSKEFVALDENQQKDYIRERLGLDRLPELLVYDHSISVDWENLLVGEMRKLSSDNKYIYIYPLDLKTGKCCTIGQFFDDFYNPEFYKIPYELSEEKEMIENTYVLVEYKLSIRELDKGKDNLPIILVQNSAQPVTDKAKFRAAYNAKIRKEELIARYRNWRRKKMT